MRGTRHFSEAVNEAVMIKPGALFTCTECNYSHIGIKPFYCYKCGAKHTKIKE